MDKYIQQIGELVLIDIDGNLCNVSSDLLVEDGMYNFNITNPETNMKYNVSIKIKEI